jgi:large subunit ribosomal protein L38
VLADLNEIQRDWLETSGPLQIKKLCEHYGIFKDLFGDYAYFVPRIFLDIKYASNDDLHPVYYGNRLTPSQTQEAPQIKFNPTLPIEEQTEKKPLWTLCLINPDGHLTENNKEYVHWMV